MKSYKKALLNHLTGNYPDHSEEPLKNIKDSLGSLRHVEGNPLFKAHITLTVESFFLDNGLGGVIPPAALPPNLQTSLPVFLFGLTDYYGGFATSSLLIPFNLGWNFLGLGGLTSYAGIYGRDSILAVGAFVPFVTPGDLIIQLIDGTANFFALVRVHCNNLPYGTFLNSFSSDLIVVDTIRISVPSANINQFENPLIFGYQTLFGKLKTDTVDPRMYQTPGDFQNQIADIPLSFPIDKNLMLGCQLDIFCQLMTFQFFVKKVEPLTLRPK